eukprot:Skav219383  [mRNA]  locus=scaffold76:758380:768154:- [translate_table: standard]
MECFLSLRKDFSPAPKFVPGVLVPEEGYKPNWWMASPNEVLPCGNQQAAWIQDKSEISERLRELLTTETYTAHEVSELSVSLAKLDVGDTEIWSDVLPALCQHRAQLSKQCVERVPLCFARARHDFRGLLQSIARESILIMPEFKAAELSKTAWACATCALREGQVLAALAQSSLTSVENFSPQGLANVIWAFATVVFVDSKLQRAVARTARTKMSSTPADFNPQNLANTLWAFAKLFCREEALFGEIAQLAEKQMDQFSPQNLSNSLWAFAKVKYDDLNFFRVASEHVLRILPEFSTQAAVNSVWAMAEISYHNPQVFEQVAREATGRTSNFKPQDLSNLIWSFAEVSHPNDDLLRSVARATCAKMASLRWNSRALNLLELFDVWSGQEQVPAGSEVWRFDGKAIQELIVIPKLPSAANQVKWGRANYFIASAHDSGGPGHVCGLEITRGELIFWRADTGAEVKRLKEPAQTPPTRPWLSTNDSATDMSVCVWDIGKGAPTQTALQRLAMHLRSSVLYWSSLCSETDTPVERNRILGGVQSLALSSIQSVEGPGSENLPQDVRDVARSSSATEQFGTLLFRLGAEKLPAQLKAALILCS